MIFYKKFLKVFDRSCRWVFNISPFSSYSYRKCLHSKSLKHVLSLSNKHFQNALAEKALWKCSVSNVYCCHRPPYEFFTNDYHLGQIFPFHGEKSEVDYIKKTDARRFSSGFPNTKRGIRNPYWRKKGLWEWRRREIAARKRSSWGRRNVVKPPPVISQNTFHEGYAADDISREFVYCKGDIRFSKKRMLLYSRLIKGLHIQDAIDWVSAIPILKLRSIYNLLVRSRRLLYEKGVDIDRVYIESYQILRQTPLRSVRIGYHYRASLLTHHRHRLKLVFRELSLKQFFHRLFIQKKVPRSLTTAMRTAIYEKKLPLAHIRDWAPFLSSRTRYAHRQNLKWLYWTRQFDYNTAYNNFRKFYLENKKRMTKESIEARSSQLQIQ